jgi:hypothetical protein
MSNIFSINAKSYFHDWDTKKITYYNVIWHIRKKEYIEALPYNMHIKNSNRNPGKLGIPAYAWQFQESMLAFRN